MLETLEFLKRLPKKVPKKFLKSASSATQAAEQTALLTRKESDQLFLLVLRVYGLCKEEAEPYHGTISSKVEGKNDLNFTLRAADLSSGIIFSISIPPREEYADERIKFRLDTSPLRQILGITIECHKPGISVKVEYEYISGLGIGEWKIDAGEEQWNEVKSDVFDLLEKAISQAEQDLSE